MCSLLSAEDSSAHSYSRVQLTVSKLYFLVMSISADDESCLVPTKSSFLLQPRGGRCKRFLCNACKLHQIVRGQCYVMLNQLLRTQKYVCVHDMGRGNDTRKRYILYTLFWTLIGDLFSLSKHFPPPPPSPHPSKKDKLPWAAATSYVK